MLGHAPTLLVWGRGKHSGTVAGDDWEAGDGSDSGGGGYECEEGISDDHCKITDAEVDQGDIGTCAMDVGSTGDADYGLGYDEGDGQGSGTEGRRQEYSLEEEREVVL
jgi:hypothetical protein